MCFLKVLSLAASCLLVALPAAQAGLLPTGKDRAQGDALFQQATTAYQGGDYNGALHLLEQANTLKPDQADAWNLRGVVFLKLKAFDQAEVAFARSVAIDPSLWAAQFNLAEVSFQQKNFARARTIFERLLAQTDRFKQGNKWELLVYKSFLCALLSGNEADGRKYLAKLPATGGVTPAFQYAQAALAFSRKDPAGANKILDGARTTFPAEANDLFSNSLQTVGWQVAPVNPAASTQLASVDPATAAAMNAAGLTNPGALSLPGAARTASPRPAVPIDPRLIAASSDPLPAAPGRDVIPVVGPAPSWTGSRNATGTGRHPAKENPAALPGSGPAPSVVPAAATPPPSPFDRDGLLLGAD